MINKSITRSFLLILLNSCTVSKNITANQTQDTWKASFEGFSGNEKIEINSTPNHLVYLSSKWNTTEGKLDVVVNSSSLPHQNTVNHLKVDLTETANIKIKGKNASGFFNINYPIYEQKKININYNSNIELLALASFLINYEDFASIPDEQSFNINGKDVRIKDLYAINFKIANEFKPYLSSKNLQTIKSYFDKKFYLQYSNLLLSIDNFPNAKLNKENKFLSEFNSIQDAENFINAFNNFSTEIKFNAFLEKYKPYYDKMILEVTQNIPKQNFITEMEHLYNKEVKNYNLYPSLTLGFGQGFGVGRENMIGNIFACFNKPEKIDNPKDLELGFNNETSLRTICIHEFGHSFINPAIDDINPTILEEKKALFEPIKNKMSEQGYTEWKICLYEHFVRANEVMVTRLLNENQKAAEILKDNYDSRSFIYLPQIIQKLDYWYNNEYLVKSYEQKVQEIISELK